YFYYFKFHYYFSCLFSEIIIENYYILDSARWLAGTYALLKPKAGCPTGWEKEGRIEQYTGLNDDNSNALHIQGEVSQDKIIRNFCIKKIHDNTIYQSWPTGKYCIYGKPYAGKQSYGSAILMYGYGHSNLSSVWPFANQWNQGSYYDLWVVKLRFDCQTSGDKKIPISLPITKPFYLLPYGSRDCQQVKWMAVIVL
ncbi:uncharacterized protein LOC116290154, partial [Actinia tenebrosa]|uniref:Uncharacterized protein LOC116290154 n=1 Tax=Actinia tenebrosa TaxID=6105 RepID=A0A6P8HBL1_ACTTE